MKNLLFALLLLMTLCVTINANELKIVSQDYSSMTCKWEAQGYNVVNSGNYCTIEFAKIAGHNTEHGKATLPVANFIFQIAHNVARIEIISSESKDIQLKKQIHPLQLPYADIVGEKERTFLKNEIFYQSSDAFPAKNIMVKSKGIMRGRTLANIHITPVTYIPSQNTAKVYTKIEFKIVYDLFSRSSNNYDGEMDIIAQSVVTNFAPTKQRSENKGINYLILTPTLLEGPAKEFAEWKKQQGYGVEVVVMKDPTLSDAQKTIKSYYDKHKIKYLLIFGDYGVFPMPKTDYNHPYHGKQFPTDALLVCVDGDDYYPDIYHGRIPAGNLEEAEVMVDKIVGYQSNPEPGNWYNRFGMCGEYQNSSSTPDVAQRLFCETAYVIYANLKGKYEFPKLPTIGANKAPSSTSKYKFHSGSLSYRTLKGTVMPKEWQDRITDKYESGKNILAFWNEGAFLVQHRDHGNYTLWGKPSVNASDIANLKNGRKLPVLFSINCLTGGLDQSSDCLSEAAIKNPNGGAVAVFGATRVSYSGWNDNLCDGFYSCFNEGFNTFGKSGANLDNKYPTSQKLGIILNYGKYFMMKNKGTGTYCKLSFHLFQCYGDPSMDIRSARPARIDALAQRTRNNTFSISVVKQDSRMPANALVCLYNKETGEQFRGYTDAKGAINFDLSLAKASTFLMTITGVNLRPIQKTVVVK